MQWLQRLRCVTRVSWYICYLPKSDLKSGLFFANRYICSTHLSTISIDLQAYFLKRHTYHNNIAWTWHCVWDLELWIDVQFGFTSGSKFHCHCSWHRMQFNMVLKQMQCRKRTKQESIFSINFSSLYLFSTIWDTCIRLFTSIRCCLRQRPVRVSDNAIAVNSDAWMRTKLRWHL